MIMINAKYAEMIYLGARDLARYKLRSGLTMLGMVFGVAAVISMMAIGEGSRRQALAQIEKLGIKNISVASRKPPEDTKVSTDQASLVIDYGIKFTDVDLIKKVVPNVKSIICGRDCGQDVSYGRRVMTTRVLATEAGYADVMNFFPAEGRFLMPLDVDRSANVAVIGQTVKRELFPLEDPMDKWIKVGQEVFRVVGVMEPRGEGAASFSAADLDRDVYIPLTAGLDAFGTLTIKQQGGSIEARRLELDEVVIEAVDSKYIPEMAKVIHAIFEKLHAKQDYVVNVPLDLLLQKEREERVWNIVMGSIAGVSLLVGGIGIMNIMLASVTERTREIGIRRALGATRRDIVQQFLVETVVLATTGGITGIILGAGGAMIVAQYAGYSTIVTFTSVLLSFGISASVGIIFGIYPAWQAAYMDPIEALRHE